MVPFLENVTRGRGIPKERLKEVGQHYFLFGGVSPINDQNRALLDALRKDFAGHGLNLPVYWGNRNWAPYLTDTLREMVRDGRRRILVLATSAYASYSGCRQYRENLADYLAALEAEGLELPKIDKLRHCSTARGSSSPWSTVSWSPSPTSPRRSATAPTSPSPPTPSRSPRPTPPARPRSAATAAPTSGSTWTSRG
ncbi:Ferrochelatase [Streptomyces glaucescens]